MKGQYWLIVAGLAAGLAAGCGGKKTDDNIITEKIEVSEPTAPVKMQKSEQVKDVEWLGSEYTCEIQRVPDDSLAMVTDETGQEFVDNRASLKIRRKDGSVFLSRTFTKSSFDACLNDDYRRTGILEGFVFDRVDDQSLVFAVSVSHPQTDEYIPLVVRISRIGDVSIARDTQMDISADYDEED